MTARKPARYLAPVALIGVAIAVVLIVRGSMATHHSSPPAAHHVATRQLPTTHHSTGRAKPTFYVVKPGDSLSTISVKTGVPIATLTALNPGIDPAALQSGQRLRLRR